MAEETEVTEDLKKKASKLPLFLGLALALAGGGGGFFAVQSGLLFGGSSGTESSAESANTASSSGAEADITFLPIEPILISLTGAHSHLRFRAQLEVGKAHAKEVEHLMPRVVDVLNNYLRALEAEDLTSGGSLAKLRAQMLRRVQIVTGDGRVNDLLIMEFVLN